MKTKVMVLALLILGFKALAGITIVGTWREIVNHCPLNTAWALSGMACSLSMGAYAFWYWAAKVHKRPEEKPKKLARIAIGRHGEKPVIHTDFMPEELAHTMCRRLRKKFGHYVQYLVVYE